jgi:hypothetical protein
VSEGISPNVADNSIVSEEMAANVSDASDVCEEANLKMGDGSYSDVAEVSGEITSNLPDVLKSAI